MIRSTSAFSANPARSNRKSQALGQHWSRQAALARQAVQAGNGILFFAMLAQKGGAQ
ncbi:MAG TPA: hypothetical protein VGD78_07125 [Chthoniobacterales bacterium]